MVRIKEKKYDYLYKGLMIFCFLTCGYMVLQIADSLSNIWSVSNLCFSYNEVRDYVGLRLSQFVIKGINPYLLETANSYTVPFLYQYTALTPLFVGYLCKVTGMGVIEGNRILNTVFVLLTTYNFYGIFKDEYNKASQKILFFLIIFTNTATFISMFGDLFVTFRPDAAGLYICSLLFLIMYKAPERTSILAVFTILLIVTKQFLIVLGGPIFVFLLIRDIRDKKRLLKYNSIRYAIECIVFGIVFFLVIRWIFPLYWTESIYGQYLSTGRYDQPLEVAVQNIKDCIYRYILYCIATAGAALFSLIWRIRSHKKNNDTIEVDQNGGKKGFGVYLLLNILVGILTCTYVARNGDDGFKYCGELIGPSMFLFMLLFLLKIKKLIESKLGIMQVIILTLLVIVTLGTYRNFGLPRYTMEDVDNYNRLYATLDKYSDGLMYVGMGATGWLLKTGIEEPENVYFNDGHIEYFNTDTRGGAWIIRALFNGKEEIGKIAKEYVADVNQKVAGKEFSVITLEIDAIVDRSLLEMNYELEGTYWLKNDTAAWETEVWIPKSAEE